MWPFKKPEPHVENVYRAVVTINDIDMKKHEVILKGMFDEDWKCVFTAQRLFNAWKNDCGSTGFAKLDRKNYLSMSMVFSMSVEFYDEFVSVNR